MEMNWGGIKGTKEKGTGTSHMTLREKIETFAKKKIHSSKYEIIQRLKGFIPAYLIPLLFIYNKYLKYFLYKILDQLF